MVHSNLSGHKIVEKGFKEFIKGFLFVCFGLGFLVDCGEDGGDFALFGKWRERDLEVLQLSGTQSFL